MATHSSILAHKIPWTEEPGRLQSIGHKEWDTSERTYTHTHSLSNHITIYLFVSLTDMGLFPRFCCYKQYCRKYPCI